MANFTAGTSFTDGVTNDVTAAKLNALVADAVPTSNLSLNSTTGTIATFNSTTGTIPTLVATTLITTGTGTAAAPAIVPTGDTNTGIFFPTADTIAFSEGGTEAMRIDSSGNVGIGTSSPSQKLDVYGGVVARGTLFLGDGSSSVIRKLNASTPLTIANSGGAAEMTIDSSGNVGIGTTSPAAKLDVRAANAAGQMQLTATTGTNAAYATFQNTGGAFIVGKDNSIGGILGSAPYSSCLYSQGAYPMAFFTDSVERLRIDSSGIIKSNGASNTYGGTGSLSLNANSGSAVDLELRVGNTNVGYFYADSTNVQIANAQAGYFALLTSNTERLRITSDGVVLFAKNTSSVSNVGYRFDTNGEFYTSHAASTSAGGTLYVYSTGASAYRFYVGLGGTVNATNTAIAAISDVRLKENIRDIDAGLSEILKLKPRTFDWKEGKGANTKNARGFIAQEIEQVFPDLVDEWRDPAPEGEEPYKSVRQDLIPVLVKAIQELSAKVTALEAA